MSLKGLVIKSNELSKNDIEKGMDNLYKLIKESFSKENIENLYLENDDDNNNKGDNNNEEVNNEEVKVLSGKMEELERVIIDEKGGEEGFLDSGVVKNSKYTRSYNQSYIGEKVSITKVKNNYFIGHLTNADLCMLSDFNEFVNQMDLVNKSFITLGKPILMCGVNVIIRDTMLLAPGKSKGLKSIAKLYKGLTKIELTKDQIENMDLLKKENPELFKLYAMQDALIALIHGGSMEDFYLQTNEIGIPISLSRLSSSYLRDFWLKSGYNGYQISEKYLLTDAAKSHTPRGLDILGEIGLKLNLYIGSYKGGRNEAYKYGYEEVKR